jgi:hypothetical protein
LARKPSGNNKLVADCPQVVEHSGAFRVIAPKRTDVVPYRHFREPRREDLLLVLLDFDGANGRDVVEFVGKDSAAATGEQVKRVFWFIHIVVLFKI